MEKKTGQDPLIQVYPEEYDNSIPDDISFPEYMFKRIVRWGDKVACVDADSQKSLTYNKLAEYSIALAAGLQNKFGLKSGDNVAVVLPNCVEYPIVIFGVTLCGACASLINPSQTIHEMSHSIKLSNPKIWIGTQYSLAKFQQIYKGSSERPSFIILDGASQIADDVTSLEDVMKSQKEFRRPTVFPKKDPALVMFSSGTTGVPKGVVLTHSNLMTARRQVEELAKSLQRKDSGKNPVAKTIPAECIGVILPFFHTFGVSGIFDNLMGGLKFVIIPNFTLDRFLQAVQDHKITIVSLVPAVAVQMAKQPVEEQYDLSSLKVVRCGASALSIETIDALKKKFKCIVYQGYGMTEATIRTHSNFRGANREGSIGIVMPFCECKVVDRETNQSLGSNQEGEIWVRGPIIMKGYIGDPSATSATVDEDGWLHTGDVGYYDKDGYFFITDRMKELIKYKGFQVSPTELEKILLTHPDVLDVAVAPVPDQSAGEVPRAYIVKRPGSTVTSEELIVFLSDKVSSYKRLRGGVVFIDAVPKTSTGKIVRRALESKVITSKL